jgi:hypothetical protein
VKIIEVVFSADGTYIRLEAGKNKCYYFSKGKFYDCCPVNCFAKILPTSVSKEIQEAIAGGGYNSVKEVKQYIKDSIK